MVKPTLFQHSLVVLQNIPYTCGDSPRREFAGGVLRRGQTVWASDVDGLRKAPRSVTVFADDLGIISVDPTWLVVADVFQP